MADLPKGLRRGLLLGGTLVLALEVLGNRRRRTRLAGGVLGASEAVPFLGARITLGISEQWMTNFHRAAAEDVVASTPAGDLIDLQSGVGRLAIEIAHRSRGMKIMTMYPSPHQVQVAEATIHSAGLGPQIKPIHGDATDIPFSNDSFDTLVSMGALHRWRDPEAIFCEIHRVLKPGGRALLYDLRQEAPEEMWLMARERIAMLQRPLFEASVISSWRASYNEPKIDLLVAISPFRKGSISALPVQMNGMEFQAMTRVEVRK